MVHTVDDVTLVDACVVPKRVFAYGTVLHHVVGGSTAGGLLFGHECKLELDAAWPQARLLRRLEGRQSRDLLCVLTCIAPKGDRRLSFESPQAPAHHRCRQ